MSEVICYGQPVRGRNWQQEWYESASRHARKRAQDLRKLGFQVVVSSMGDQITSEGRCKMSMLTVVNAGDREIPNPSRIEYNNR
jgi:hypothetical protein